MKVWSIKFDIEIISEYIPNLKNASLNNKESLKISIDVGLISFQENKNDLGMMNTLNVSDLRRFSSAC